MYNYEPIIPFNSYRDVVEINGKHYLLDMRYTADHGNECMAFPCSSTGDVTSWLETWAKDGMELTEEEFAQCKREFIGYMAYLDSLPEADFDYYGCLPYAGPDDD